MYMLEFITEMSDGSIDFYSFDYTAETKQQVFAEAKQFGSTYATNLLSSVPEVMILLTDMVSGIIVAKKALRSE